MRVGDFATEVVPYRGGRVKELPSGHVLARPGQVYRLRLRNHGPLYCVANVEIDGSCVTGGGLVLEPWGTTELERRVDGADDGRFTVAAEGDEAVFGPDGGRDNPALGLIDARFRRELPKRDGRRDIRPLVPSPALPEPWRVGPIAPRLPSRFPPPPGWSPPMNSASATWPAAVREEAAEGVERAAGTGLSGHSDQRFVPFALGPLESEATVIQLRLVIGTLEAIEADEPRARVEHEAPARPAARP